MPPTPSATGSPAALQRRLGLPGAIVIGIGSMVGAGVYTSLGLAAATAGSLLMLALALAGVTAWVNATAMAQLSAVHPTSGGAYVFGRRQLDEWAGFVAGWGFVTGKSASIAAMAYTFALYLVPTTAGTAGWTARWVAVAAVVAVTGVNLAGITRTVQATVVIVVPVLLVLGVVIVAGFADAASDAGPVCRRARASTAGRPPGRRPAVLRVRRVCARRDDGRGGPRAAAHHPPGRVRCAGVHVRALPAAGPEPAGRPRRRARADDDGGCATPSRSCSGRTGCGWRWSVPPWPAWARC